MSGKKEEAAASPAPEASGSKTPMLPLLVALINTVGVLAAVGTLVYTRILFKRPEITETSERARIEALKAAPPAKAQVPGTLVFEPTTINISAAPGQPKPVEGSPGQIGGKLHYATVGFVMEIGDAEKKGEIEAIKPLITDRLLTLMGKKQFHELTSVQGRYVLKTEIIELSNELWKKRQKKDDKVPAGPSEGDDASLVTNIYFTQFIVQ